MKPHIFKIKAIGLGSLSVMPKPSPEWLADDFRFYKEIGITLIVSLLEESEAYEIGLQSESKVAEQLGIGFLSFPIADRGLPESLYEFKRFVSDLYGRIKDGEHAAVHCRAGIGRSGLVAGSVLIHEGFEPDKAFDLISEKRGVAVPDTIEQVSWLNEHWRELI